LYVFLCLQILIVIRNKQNSLSAVFVSKTLNLTFLLNNLILIIIRNVREHNVIRAHCLLFFVHIFPLFPLIAVQISCFQAIGLLMSHRSG